MFYKITYNRTIFLFFILYFNYALCASAVDITGQDDKNNGKTLKLQTDLILTTSYTVNDNLCAFETPVAGIELQGELAEQFAFETSLALEELLKKNVRNVLDTVFITFSWPGAWKLNLGLFKTPFSQEYNLGKKARPYLSHSLSSKKIGPGLDKGISLAGEGLADIFNLEIGLFNGTGQDLAILNNLLAVGKGSLSLKFQDTARLDFGYSAFYSWAALTTAGENSYEQTFGQGGFIRFRQDFSAWKQTMKFFCFAEYLEKRQLAETIANGAGWSFGIFNALAFRVELMEIFASSELYKAPALADDPANEWQLTGGLNFYFYKDMVRLSFYYKAESWYSIDIFEQSIASSVYLYF